MIESRSALIDLLHTNLDDSDGGVAVFCVQISETLEAENVDRMLSRVAPTAAVAHTADAQFTVVDGHRNVVAHAALTAGLFRDVLLQADDDGGTRRVSVGVAIGWPMISTAETLLTDAESACNSAARRTGSCTEIFDDSMRFLELRRIELANALGAALESKAIDLKYQPTVELATSRWVCLEAYLRWIDRDQGWVPPMDIIPAAERADLAQDLVGQVVDIACDDLVAWQAADCSVPWVSLNVSPGQLALPGFHETMLLKLSEHGLDAHRIGLDVPAACLSEPSNESVDLLSRISESGICLSLDNVDETTLQLEAVNQIEFRKFKIHPQILTGIHSPDGAQRLSAILQRIEQLGATPIVKGVETTEQLDDLLAVGATYAQGFLFAHPLPASEVDLDAFRVSPKLPYV
ncbi:MAG: EAL domain-containing protein [Acidimicrobiales bacterium]